MTARKKASRKPNHLGRNIRFVRLRINRSQAEFARLIRLKGAEAGEPNQCSKRIVQKWESGDHAALRPNYQRAIEAVTGVSYERLCMPWTDLMQGLERDQETLKDFRELWAAVDRMTDLLNAVAVQITPPRPGLSELRRRRRVRPYTSRGLRKVVRQ
jgi:transcriptional regulator with XRE-family HTH domain